MITAMRIEWPSKRILIVQTNLGAAYRRVHTKLQIGSTCIAIVGKLAFLCLGLPFGTMSAQKLYTTINEAEIYFENDLLTDASGDATNLQSPHRHL